MTAPEHEGVGFPSSIFGSPTDHLICRSDQSAGILSHDPVVLRGGPLTVDSEDCAAPWPGSLPAVSNAVLSKTPIVVEVGGSSSNTQVSLDASLGHLVGCRLDLSVAPTVVLDPGNPDLLGFRVRVGALCRYLGIFRHGLAVPLRWLCRSRLLDSLLPDSFPLDLVTAIGTSVLERFSVDLRFPVSSLHSSFESLRALVQPLILKDARDMLNAPYAASTATTTTAISSLSEKSSKEERGN